MLRVLLVLVALAVLSLALSARGGTWKDEFTRSPDDAKLQRPLQARCDEVGVGNERFPKASQKRAWQAGGALAARYPHVGVLQIQLRGDFANTMVWICRKTTDPAKQPAEQVGELADDAISLRAGTELSFSEAYRMLLPRTFGDLPVLTDDELITETEARCQRVTARTQKLLGAAANPAHGLTTPRAKQLDKILTALSSDLRTLATRSTAKNARTFADHFHNHVDEVMRLAREVAKGPDAIFDPAANSADLKRRATHAMGDLAASRVEKCGKVFNPQPQADV